MKKKIITRNKMRNISGDFLGESMGGVLIDSVSITGTKIKKKWKGVKGRLREYR